MEESRGLSCSVCYNGFTSIDDQSVPRNLNCGHTFCTACLQKIAAQTLHMYVICPACKTETPLLTSVHPKSSISSLPKNFGLLEIIECKETKSNTNHASTCDTAGIDKDKSNNNICKEHDEAKKVYCLTDQCLICIYCQIYGEHQGHNCELASTLANSSREELYKISEKLETDCYKLCKAASGISDMENLIMTRQSYLKNRVKKYMVMLHRNLTRQEANIISQIDKLSTCKLEVLLIQEKTLTEVMSKCNELYLLIQTVQKDGDKSVIEEKPTIQKLVDEMSYVAEACQTKPKADNNLIFEIDKDVLNILKKLSGIVMELECDEEQSDGSVDSKLHLLDNALSDLEKEMHIFNNQSSRATEQEDATAEYVDNEEEEEDDDDNDDENDDDDDEDDGDDEDDEDDEDDVDDEGESDHMTSTASEADEAEQEEDGNRENTNDANTEQAEDDEAASEGELLGAVGGNALPEAQQDENKRKDIHEKQSLLRELQHEIERLKLLGPTGEVIRVIDDSSSSSLESLTDTDDNEHNAHSLQLDFQIRVNNDLGRTKSRATGATAVQGMLPNEDILERYHKKHKNPRTCGKKRCSVVTCQHHVHPSLQCKNCCRVFCRRCALLSLTCNKSDCGHSYVGYRHSGHHLNKNIKSRFGKKLQKTFQRGCTELAPQWVCKRCTMLNEGHVLVCGACETSKDYDPEQTRSVCPMCTLVNEPGKTTCELCDTDLEEIE